MVQPDSTNPADEQPADQPEPVARITRPTLGSHVQVHGAEIPVVGLVVASDPWFDTLRLRGVAPNSQLLTEWFPDDRPARLWYRLADLEVVESDLTLSRP
jgi:hypothetical protein